MKYDLGIILRSAIEHHCLTQKEVADAICISPQTLNNYIHNRRVPNIITFYHLLLYLRIDIYEMIALLHKQSKKV